MRVRLAVDRRRSWRSFASDSPSPSISPCIAHLTPASLPDFLSPSHDLAPVYYRACSRPSARQPQAPAMTGKASTTSAVSHQSHTTPVPRRGAAEIAMVTALARQTRPRTQDAESFGASLVPILSVAQFLTCLGLQGHFGKSNDVEAKCLHQLQTNSKDIWHKSNT
jgi:hypothetical protein